MTLLPLLQVLFVALRLIEVIAWPWAAVFVPLYLMIAGRAVRFVIQVIVNS